MDKILGSFKKMNQKAQRLLIACLASFILLLFFGFKDAGHTYYNSSIYEAGSVFQPEEYSISGLGTDYDNQAFGNDSLTKALLGDAEPLNNQVKKMRQTNLMLVIVFGISALGSIYLLWQEKDFKDFLISIR